MALCASVMTGIYAAPVMAADAIYSDGKASVETTSDGTINFAVYTTQSDGTKNVARIASFDADRFSIHNGSGSYPVFYIGRQNGDFMAADGDFAVDEDGNVTANGTLRVAGGDFTVDGDGNVVSLGNVTSTDGNITYNLNTVGANTAGITHENVTKNITKTNIENSSITSAGELYINKANGQTNFSVDKYGNANVRNTLIAKEISVNNDRFTVDKNGTVHSDGTVYSESDFKTTDKAGNLKYSLNTIGTNTAGITRENVTKNITKTNIENSSITSAGELYINKANGQTNFSVDKYGNANVRNTLIAKEISVNNDRFTVDKNGTVHSDGTVYSERDFITTDKAGNQKYSLNTVGADLDILEGNVGNIGENVGGITRTEGATDPGTGTTTIEDTLSVSKDSVSANVGNSFFNVEEDGIYMSNNGNGLAVGEDGISAYSGNASFNISNNNYNVTVGNSTMVVNDNGATFTNGEENGSTVINGGVVTSTGDFITLDKDGKQKYTLNTIGADLDTLEGNVGNIGENVGGIDRVDADNDGKKETTIVEDTLSVSKDQIGAVIGDSAFVLNDNYAGIYADNKTSIIVASDGINLNGTVNFIGHDGNSYTLSNLEGRVYDLEQKTQNITSTDPGQGGSSEVPPTGDGHTGFEGDVTVGGDINADEGNFNKVNTDEITVGDSTFIDSDSVNSNEGNFKDKVTVGGEGGTSITGDGMTVGTADKGTTVSDSGVSIKNEYGSVETGVVDGKNDVVVTDEDGNRTSLVDTAGRVDNLEQGVAELNNRVGELEDRIDKVGAMAAAIANLRTMGYDPAAPTEVAVGIGQYRDETGAALGLFHYPNRDFMLSLSVSTSGDEVMGGIGATWKFGRKSPEKVAEIKKAQAEADARRAEEAKLAKAEEMKQAAKEAKIKAQQERHAKLAAERAAQAEAAK